MKSVRITVSVGIDDRGAAGGGVGNNYLTFYVNVPDRFTPDDVTRKLAKKLEDALEKYVDFGKD